MFILVPIEHIPGLQIAELVEKLMEKAVVKRDENAESDDSMKERYFECVRSQAIVRFFRFAYDKVKMSKKAKLQSAS